MEDERWPEIFSRCRELGLLISKPIKRELLELEEPMAILAHAPNMGITKGVLSSKNLQSMIRHHTGEIPDRKTSETVQPSVKIGRVIATIKEPEPMAPVRLHGLPDFDIDDFPLNANEVDTDIAVHFDITGNSITEGKMNDIGSLFNSRLDNIRRMIIAGNLPSRCSDIAKLQANRRSYTCLLYTSDAADE